MAPGGSIAFYEVAATLIPVLFFGGLFVERLRRPPDLPLDPEIVEGFGNLPEKEVLDALVDAAHELEGTPRSTARLAFRVAFWRRNRTLLLVGACLLPVAAACIAFAEILAVDAIVSRSAGPLHAWVVGTTLVAGGVVLVVMLCVPWLLKLIGRFSGRGTLWLLLPTGLIAASIAAIIVASLAAGPHITSETTHSLSSNDRLWLEHLVATSDYRIDKLEAEEAATGEQNPHIAMQRTTQRRQCDYLKRRIAAADSTNNYLPKLCARP
jgi:hypothetical protein